MKQAAKKFDAGLAVKTKEYVDLSQKSESMRMQLKLADERLAQLKAEIIPILKEPVQCGGFLLRVRDVLGRASTEINVRGLWKLHQKSKSLDSDRFFDLIRALVTECRKYVPKDLLDTVSKVTPGQPSKDLELIEVGESRPRLVQEQEDETKAAGRSIRI